MENGREEGHQHPWWWWTELLREESGKGGMGREREGEMLGHMALPHSALLNIYLKF